MKEVLEIATGVGTPLALLGLVAALLLYAYQRRLRHDEKKLESLPPDQRATSVDEFLTRYGIDGRNLTKEQKFSLIKEEMDRRYRKAALAMKLAAGVFVICFVSAVLAYAFHDPKKPEEAKALKIRPLKVMHYKTEGMMALPKGLIGRDSYETRHGDAATLKVELSKEAYCYIIAFNFDGTEQLLWPEDEKGAPSDRVKPHLTDQMHCPAGENRLYLDENAESGLQVYVVVASTRSLPAYAEWRAKRPPILWRSTPAGTTVYEADEKGAYLAVPGIGTDRSSIRGEAGAPPIADLCRALLCDEIQAVEAIAFPVLSRNHQ